MARISAGIIGLGNIGYKYDIGKKSILTHAKAINSSKYFDLKAGIDKDKKNLREFKKFFNCNIYSSAKEALKKEKLDLVIVSTNTQSAEKICSELIKSKSTKIIMLEKPGSNNAKELEKLIKLAKLHNKFIFINYFRLFNPQLENF